MSDDQLIDELAGRAELFALEANSALRRWFTRKLLTYVQAGPPPHDDRADTLAAVALARSLVEECRVALQPQPGTDLRLLLLQDLAVRAAYGALGVHPAALLHDDRADYLLFIVKRRIFAVDRMERGVNDDTVFRYPDGSVLLSKPSKQARPSWTGVIEIPPGSTPRYPFKLSAPTGTGNPASAALLLFEPNRLSADRSAFDCAGAAMAVHIVALLDAADDPSTLATAVSAGERYYTLDHPHGSSGVVDDTLVQGITPVLLADAAAGDHVELTVAFGWNCPPAGSAATLVAPDHEEPI